MVNTLILNRDSFSMPADGWYQIAPLGEFAHAQAGVVQVVDREACEAMVNRFRAEAATPNFAGLLVDFDHFSLDGEKRSEAAGWITDLENRDGGLFARIRWSDLGEEAVKGGRYRFLSPVWARGDCIDLGNGRVRPVRLLNAAVTNDPNLKGMRPLSNSAASANGGATRYKWVLGDSPGGHCPSCAALAGQVHTMAEWESAGATPRGGKLYCQGHCHCSLEPTDDPATGSAGEAPLRRETGSADEEEEELMNAERSLRMAEGELPGDAELIRYLANKGWSDAARAASLAVRRAKAGKRQKGGGQSSGGAGGGGETPEVDYNDRWEREWSGQQGGGDDDDQQRPGGGGDDDGGEQAPPADETDQTDYEEWFREEGMSSMSPEDVEAFTDQIRQKLSAGEELSYVEEGFLEERTDAGYSGEGEGDPVFNWAEQQADREATVFEATGMDARDARGRAADLAFRQQQGEGLTAAEQQFLETYDGIMGNPPSRRRSGETAPGDNMANAWSDAARQAALAVRRAKVTTRRDADGTIRYRPLPPDDGKMFGGGTPYFDEKTGKHMEYVLPRPKPAPRSSESQKGKSKGGKSAPKLPGGGKKPQPLPPPKRHVQLWKAPRK